MEQDKLRLAQRLQEVALGTYYDEEALRVALTLSEITDAERHTLKMWLLGKVRTDPSRGYHMELQDLAVRLRLNIEEKVKTELFPPKLSKHTS